VDEIAIATDYMGCFVLVLQFHWNLGDLKPRNSKDQREEDYNTPLQ